LRFEDLQFQILYWNRFVNTCCEEGSEKILVFSKLNLCSEYSREDKKTLIDLIMEKIDTDIEVYFVGEGNMSDLGEFFPALRKAHSRISKVFIIFYPFSCNIFYFRLLHRFSQKQKNQLFKRFKEDVN